MKGIAETFSDTIMVIVVVILILVLTVAILPTFNDFIKTAAFDSSSLVAKELSELITVSAAAPNQISIIYNPSSVKYDVDINNRIVKVSAERAATSPDQTLDTAYAKIAVDVVNEFSKVNVFGIKKNADGVSIQAS